MLPTRRLTIGKKLALLVAIGLVSLGGVLGASASDGIQRLREVVRKNASAAEEMASTAEELAAHAEQLGAAVSFFKVGGQLTAVPGSRRLVA